MKAEIRLVEEGRAVCFWEESPYASVFTHPHVLRVLCERVEWWLCIYRNQEVCLWPVCLDANGKPLLPGSTYYVGPLWASYEKRVPNHRRLRVYISVYEAFIKHFIKRYGAIVASMPVGLDDVRVFDWWNYNEADDRRFRISPRYTACIEGLTRRSINDIKTGFRKVRRYEERQIVNRGAPLLCEDWSEGQIATLYNEVFYVKGEAPPSDAIVTIHNMAQAVKIGFGEVVAYYYPEDGGALAYAGLLLYGKGVANLVYSMVASKHRRSGLVAWAMVRMIERAKSRGCDCFDFNGANSPMRGDDKHSYGAVSKLFFEIELRGE